MFITVVMCTRNRAEQLRRVLETAAAMHVPEGLVWEMLLVDNGSTDQTAAVVDEFVDRLPIRRVVEPTPGLSNARNCGVAEARGTYICWTDDDVVIDARWLAGYAAAFVRHPEAGFFGGPIEPVLEGEPPQWFRENYGLLSHMLAERNLGSDVFRLGSRDDTMPFGANYAVRTELQRRHLYDPNLGVAPHQRRLGEESKSILAIAADGAIGFWVPEARVRHMIPTSRQTEEYVRVYQKSAGESWAYLEQVGADNFLGPSTKGKARLLNVPLYVWRDMFRHRVAYSMLRRSEPSGRWLWHLRQYGFLSGAVDFWRQHGASA